MLKLLLSLALIVFLLLGISNISAIRINEVEMNPAGTDAGNEWIELYSEEEIFLEGYKIVNADEKEMNLSGNFSGYLIYGFEKQWLDNSNESVFLYNGSELIDETGLFDDSKNDDNTYQFCSSGWKFMSSTKGSENNCTEIQQQTTATQNETIEETSDSSSKEEEEIDELGEPETVASPSKRVTGNTVLETINLDSKDIKTDNNKEALKKNLALGGIVSFCLLFGGLFFLKFAGRKGKNEFR